MVFLAGKSALRSISSPPTKVRHMAWQPGETGVVACATSAGGRIIDMEQSETPVIQFAADVDIKYIAWSPTGNLLATLGKHSEDRAQEASIWSSNGTKIATLLNLDYLNNILGPPLKFNPSGGMIVLGRNHGFEVFEVHTGNSLQFVRNGYRPEIPHPLVWKNEMEFFFSKGAAIIHWHVGQERQLQVLTGHNHQQLGFQSINSLNFNPESGILASGCKDRKVRLWNSQESAASIATFNGHYGSVKDVLWHPRNSRIIASAVQSSGQVFLWDTVTKSILHNFTDYFVDGGYHTNRDLMCFSPDGRHLAMIGSRSCGVDSSFGKDVVVRKVNTGKVVAVCKVEGALGISWSPKGNKLSVKSQNSGNGYVDIGAVFRLDNVVEMKLKVLSLMRVAECLEGNINNQDDEDTVEVLEGLGIPNKVIPEVRQYLN